MIRHTFTITALLGGVFAHGQTVTSVQDGLWDDPATWDCGCLPITDSVDVLHAVEITGNIIFFNPQVRVASGGLLFSAAPYSIAITETMVSEGELQLKGDVDIDGSLTIHAGAQVVGEVHNDALLLLAGGAAHLHVEGDLVNEGLIDGLGSICVTELVVNADSLMGQIDLCDATPTTATPPILDINTGFVGPGVTFCSASSCVAATNDPSAMQAPSIHPVPADGQLFVEGLPQGTAEMTVLDMWGRRTPAERTGDAIDVSRLDPGNYLVRVRSGTTIWSLRAVVR